MKLLLLILFAIVSGTAQAAPYEAPDKIVVIKSDRVLLTIKDNKILKEYPIALGKNPIGDKVMLGDDKTPEGRYQITSKNPNSKYHLNLAISYPSRQDKRKAKELGVNPGGHIVLHGLPNNAPRWVHDELMTTDWTNGCIALANKHIKELFKIIRIGTSIDILP